jgi:acetyl-CoA carboxylase carboxyltransferase component
MAHVKTYSLSLRDLSKKILEEEAIIREGGGPSGKERQERLGRLTARERIKRLVDNPNKFLELGLWAAYGMYEEWGGLPAAGCVTGIGEISGHACMIIANDATVKAGAMFPQSVKKVLHMQRIAYECRLPIIYLVDSSGVFLPLQDEIFPDEDDFGRIFRNNAVISAAGIPQYAAIMGNCIAGGGYLPVLCDKLLMTEGSGLYLAGPALVKAAIGQVVDTEELGGAAMHAQISGTVDFREANDEECIERLRSLVDLLPHEEPISERFEPAVNPQELLDLIPAEGQHEYDVHKLLQCIVDKNTFQEYKAEYGTTLVTGYAKINGIPVGIVASQRIRSTTARGEVEIGGVLYSDSADKAARFILDCNQTRVPLIFFQDVVGFMVGKDAEQSGIIRSGAKLVNAVSNSIVPKITIIVGNSFGAGNYALCGKAYDPQFIFAWPNAKYAVMGGDQASETLFHVQQKSAERKGIKLDEKAAHQLREQLKNKYEAQMDIRYGAARGWVDGIIQPQQTRSLLVQLLPLVLRKPLQAQFHTGVIQV